MVNERKHYYAPEDILAEVEQTLADHKPGEIDWITFVGSGETTLHSGIGKLIRDAKALTKLPIAVITNGSLLYLLEVRKALSAADAVLPSLDAGNPQLYRHINRPHPGAKYDRLLEGLIAFRNEYQGKFWVEVMLVRDLNDKEFALRELSIALQDIQPDEVHLLQPTRPPAESWVQPPDEEGLLRAAAILGEVAKIVYPASGIFDLSGSITLTEAVIGIITRHPIPETELVHALESWSPDEVAATLSQLEQSGRAQRIERFGTLFWSAASGYYANSP